MFFQSLANGLDFGGNMKPTEDTTTSAIERLADALIARQPKAAHPLDHAGMSQERRNIVSGLSPDGSPLKGKRWRVIPGKNHDTGATFDQHVVESREFFEGRVTELRNYKLPDGIYKHQANGGSCPDGKQIYINGQSPPVLAPGEVPAQGSLTEDFLIWRWREFYQIDLRAIVGKGVRTHFCLNEEWRSVPWLEGSVATSASVE
jgi:hypothetical protein